MKQFRFVHAEARRRAAEYCMTAPEGSLAEFKDATRTGEQNALMWPLLGCVAEQVQWDGEWLTDEQWKDLFTAVLRKQKCVRGLEGGIVFLGGRTSRMGKREFSDLIELIYSFGAERGVKFGDEIGRAA